MPQRMVTDAAGRTWTCTLVEGGDAAEGEARGQDVRLSCTTAEVPEPVELTVGWQWETMAQNGLARLIMRAASASKEGRKKVRA